MYDELRALHAAYGPHASRQHYFVAPSPAASAAVFARLRRDSPDTCGPYRITAVKDLGTGVDTGDAQGEVRLPWTPGDMHICYTLDCGAAVTVRASGTEVRRERSAQPVCVCVCDHAAAAKPHNVCLTGGGRTTGAAKAQVLPGGGGCGVGRGVGAGQPRGGRRGGAPHQSGAERADARAAALN